MGNDTYTGTVRARLESQRIPVRLSTYAQEQISIEVHEEFSADILLPFSRKITPPQNDYSHGSEAHSGLTKFASHRKKTIA